MSSGWIVPCDAQRATAPAKTSEAGFNSTFGREGLGEVGGQDAWEGMVVFSTPSDKDALADANWAVERRCGAVTLGFSLNVNEHLSLQTWSECEDLDAAFGTLGIMLCFILEVRLRLESLC